MQSYLVHLIQPSDSYPVTSEAMAFKAEADDLSHAIEQAQNAYPGADMVSATRLDGQAAPHLMCEGEAADFLLVPDAPSAWVRIDNIAVHLRRTEDGVIVELFPSGAEDEEALASCHEFFQDAASAVVDREFTAAQRAAHEPYTL